MKKFSLKKSERLCKRKEFERVFKEGIVRHNSILSLRVMPNQLTYSRLGIVVAKKRVKSAARRNRLKRLIREAFRLNKLHLPERVDIIVNLKQVDKISLSEVSNSILKLIK